MAELGKKRRKKLQATLEKRDDYGAYRDGEVEVRSGGPCGRGLFAVRRFLPGELVIEIEGQLLKQKEYDASRYVMELSKKWFLEPYIPAAFSNHSCSPNCELIRLTKYTMGLVAICNIEPGMEINYDYQWPALDWIPECGCGALNCRGWVVAEEELPEMRKLAKKRKRRK